MSRLVSLSLAVLLILNACSWRIPRTAPDSIRVAVFNPQLTFQGRGEISERLTGGEHPEARRAAAIIQRASPDVLVLLGVDHDFEYRGIGLFETEYLARGQFGESAVRFTYRFVAPVNTGLLSGQDLDGDRFIAMPGDAHAPGDFAGQGGMVVLSRLPIDPDATRTFQRFPRGRLDASGEDSSLPRRLSSRSHWDVALRWDDATLRLLVSNPLRPPADDTAAAARRDEELAFWDAYLGGEDLIVDDAGRRGGLTPTEPFVLAGTLNADPFEGPGGTAAINALLRHARTGDDPLPRSRGAEAYQRSGINRQHQGPPGVDSWRGDVQTGNRRYDYVLPSRELSVRQAGVFWPRPETERGLEWVRAFRHHLVWADIARP
ncbi:MAG: endonuclease/exonuclease/phosphatase family protein [Pseudomonadota bacterium]